MKSLTNITIGAPLRRSVSEASGEPARDEQYRFNRYNTVDCAPALSPPPHESGRKYKYRQRYAIKTRSRMIVHEPPDMLKQYVWKPWTKPPESPREPASPPKPKVRSKKSPPILDHMEKKGLVNELQWQHPTRVLDIGTVNANASRALTKESLPLAYLPRIKTCLSDITQLATRTKRTCQQAIGQYLERLKDLEHLDGDDKLILGRLCRPFTEKDAGMDDTGATQDSVELEEAEDTEANDECDDSNDNKNAALLFFMSLLTAIYNSKAPTKKAKEPPESTVSAVCAFLVKAEKILPEQTGKGEILFHCDNRHKKHIYIYIGLIYSETGGVFVILRPPLRLEKNKVRFVYSPTRSYNRQGMV